MPGLGWTRRGWTVAARTAHAGRRGSARRARPVRSESRSRDRGLPSHRHQDRRDRIPVRRVRLSESLPVRRAFGRSGDAAQRHLPGADGRRPRGVGVRLDDAWKCVGLPGRVAGGRPRRDEGARGRSPRGDCRMPGARASHRSLPVTRARISARREGTVGGTQAAGSDSETLHAGRRQRVRRGNPRCLWESVRGELLRHVRPPLHDPRPVVRPRTTLCRRVPGPICAVISAWPDARIPLGRSKRCARSGRRSRPDRRRPAEHARGVDRP